MAAIREINTKSGMVYEIGVSRGRGVPKAYKRWHPPVGWSKKNIERELNRVARDFEKEVEAGIALTRAERKEKELLEAAEAAKIQTLRQFSERVFMPAKIVQISENTRSSFQGCLDNRILPALGDMKMPDIAPANITAFLLDIQTEGLSHGSVIKHYTVLHSLFKMAYMNDVIEKNPMDKVVRPKPRKDEIKNNDVEAYTAAEVAYIMECLSNESLKWQALIRLLIDTGIRRGECCGLQWNCVDFDNNTITVANNLCYTPQKGVYLDTPKNGKTRTIDVDPDVMKLLRQLRLEQIDNGVISQYVFTQDGSALPMHPQSPTRYMSKFAKRYGVQDFHPHKLRHSYASIAITNGADVASVSENLGHSDKAVTLRMYTHADTESKKRASQIVRDALKQKQA